MKQMDDFPTQLKIANKYEQWLGSKMDVECYNNDNKYDILLKNGLTIEVKNDFKSETGNVALEYFCRNKPSGISVSQADYYIYLYPKLQEVWKIKTEKLKQMIEDFKNGCHVENWTTELYFMRVSGGDDNLSKMYLVRQFDIRHLFDIKKMDIPYYEK